jgi:hypothetical protein
MATAPRATRSSAGPAQRFGAQRLVERDLGQLWEGRDPTDPAPALEALVTGRVLDDSVERNVVADDDLPHFGSPFGLALSAIEAFVQSKTERRISSLRGVIAFDAHEGTSRCEDASVTAQTLARARWRPGRVPRADRPLPA